MTTAGDSARASELPQVVMYGASGHALAIAMLAAGTVFDVMAFIDDYRGDTGATLDGKPIISFAAWQDRYLPFPAFVAIGDPKARRTLVGRMEAAGARFIPFYDRAPLTRPYVSVASGTVVAAVAYVGPNTTIGNHVQVMPACTLGHDIALADFVTVCPGAAIAGHVVVEEGALVGMHVVIVNGTAAKPIVIGRGARIAAGAVVTKSVLPGAVVAGNPARPLRELARLRARPR